MQRFIFYFLLLLFPPIVQGQNHEFLKDKHKIGFMTGYGDQRNLNVRYTNKVTFFSAQHYYSLLKRSTWSFEVLSQPQFNYTEYKFRNWREEYLNGYEFGLNIGFLARRNFFQNKLSTYGFISTGPHYVSGVPDRQISGLLFSDNLFIGINIKVYQKWYFDTRLGFRHLSNANLRFPNRGINSMVLQGGFLYSY